MEKNLKLLMNLNSRISKAFTNFKKSPRERITDTYVETRLENLEQLWVDFKSEHQCLIQNYDEAELEKTDYIKNDLYEKSEDIYIDYKCELRKNLSKAIRQRASSIAHTSTEGVISSATVKLPKITIPTFSGKYEEWTTFRDLFTSLVHSNDSLDDVQKLHYLKGYLTGEAEQLIRQIPITAANYEACWQQIEKRFNNKRYLCNCILKRLFHHNTCKSESALALRELLDTTTECLHALNNLGIDTKSWDVVVIYIVSSKLDTESRRLWEVKVSELSDELPTLSNFTEFMEHRFRSLEFLDAKTKTTYKNLKSLHIATPSCAYCSESHKLCNCKKFAIENVDTRRKFVQANSLCYNCLGENHTVYSCRQSSRCRVCRKKHHSLLHPKFASKSVDNKGSVDENNGTVAAAATAQSDSINVVSCFSDVQSQSLLATALVEVETVTGTTIVLRALLDQGSQASFISESAVQLLGIRKVPMKASISRLGDDASDTLPCKASVEIKVHSRLDQSFVISTKAYVLKKLTSLLPERKIVYISSKLSTMELADPSYGKPSKIDLILGTGVYSQILLEGLIKGSPGAPVAQKTTLGWILSGEVHGPNHHSAEKGDDSVVSLHVRINENDLLKRFWELESDDSLVRKNLMTDDEKKCERIFSETTKRDESGRYIVKLPFKSEDPSCKYSGSKNIAHKRFYALERKFVHNPEFQSHYASVINDYLELDHMEPVPKSEIGKTGVVYLPHHAVLRNDKSTTKLRVVFDASCPGINGASLNDDLLVGPTLQPELRHIIMRWRRHPIALVADIVKMYRQVKVSHDDADYQRLIWRDSPESEIQHFRLLRVTFGTSSAPYLAVRCLQQLAYDEGHNFPSVSERVLKDFYVDDLMTGCENVSEGKEIHKSMNLMLSRGGFQLQKWSSSSAELLHEIETENTERGDSLELKLDEDLKILGLTWSREKDEFKYTVQLPELEKPVTKRRVISDIAKLYDPLGWIAPCVITAKIFIQKIWLSGIGWDDDIPHQLLNEWITYRDSLSKLTNFCIPRWLGVHMGGNLQLQGFCDASNDAYAAVVYAKVIDENGVAHVNLVTSKTKVSPIKQVSIPKLELCGATLLAKLLHEVSSVLGITRENVHAWTDSSVVLAWLRSHPSRWKTFVANRVSEILTLMDAHQWSHVQSSDNPADCASRGISPSELVELQLWKSGPNWLKNKDLNYNTGNIQETDLEVRKKKVINHNILTCNVEDILTKYSSLTKLTRVVAYCRRFLMLKPENKTKIKTTWLNSVEISEALLTCIRLCQARYFKEDIENLIKLGNVKNKSILTSLNPYLDENGVLRVGGRLRHAKIPAEMKNPVLIPHGSAFTDLLVDHAHKQTLHGGPQLMLNYIRMKYWVINAKSLVRKFVRKCVTCVRHAAHINQQLMGQLPEARATACRPFSRSGVDYAGPISVRSTKGRGYRSTKGYICIFICMSTRAVHLEIVSDMTSDAFLAAFKRFTARRGHCSNLWSDNGTTFVGANKELQNLLSQEKSGINGEIAEWLGNNGTTWHYIPPHSPNFGGLWESGVKSTKHHLKRIIGNHTLTFEEMATVLAQIEACLNSRPLSQISSNSEDPLPLTPGHFLVGEPLVLPPDCNFESSNVSSLKRWHLTQRLVQDFWRRWSQEYLTQFYHRYKWSQKTPEPKVGDVVLVKENDLPPARWLYGVITHKHTGLDNITRVVSLRCKGSIIKRPVSKLIVLPVTTE